MGKCFSCDGTGKKKVPSNEKAFDEAFEYFDSMGSLTLGECRDKALERVGYTLEKCDKCNGTGEE